MRKITIEGKLIASIALKLEGAKESPEPPYLTRIESPKEKKKTFSINHISD